MSFAVINLQPGLPGRDLRVCLVSQNEPTQTLWIAKQDRMVTEASCLCHFKVKV